MVGHGKRRGDEMREKRSDVKKNGRVMGGKDVRQGDRRDEKAVVVSRARELYRQ